MIETTGLSRIKRFAANTAGRDFAVGDIHGHFSRLQPALEAVDFDPVVDRLFSVGDLIDRGPESRDALDWLAKPWFHPVRGNHDDYVAHFDTCDVDSWVCNGGEWFTGLSLVERIAFALQFAELPIAIEVETPGGLVGIIHADCPVPSWINCAANCNRLKAPSGWNLCCIVAFGHEPGFRTAIAPASKVFVRWWSAIRRSGSQQCSATCTTSTQRAGWTVISRCWIWRPCSAFRRLIRKSVSIGIEFSEVLPSLPFVQSQALARRRYLSCISADIARIRTENQHGH